MNIFDVILIPLGYLMRFCYWLVPNYAIALLFFAIIIKAILFPLGIKQQKNTVKQASLKPKEMAIRKRYAGRTDKATQQKVQEEVMKLYQQENFNPMAGCLPMLVELPIIIALYNVVNNPLKYLCGLSDYVEAIAARITEIGAEAVTQIQMVSVMKADFSSFADILPADFTISSLPNFNIFGNSLDVSQTPSFSPPTILLLIPILVFVAQFLSTKITRKFTYTPQQEGDAGNSMKVMEFTMPLMSVFFAFTMPAIIGIYWTYQSLIQIVRQFLLAKLYPYPKFTEEDYKKAELEMNGKMSKKERKRINSEKKVKSLHRIDDEEDEDDDADEDETPLLAESNEADSGLVKKAILKDDSDRHNKNNKTEEEK